MLPSGLVRQFDQAVPNNVYVSDITYIRTAVGWLYLAVMIDLFSRKVVDWALQAGLRCLAQGANGKNKTY